MTPSMLLDHPTTKDDGGDERGNIVAKDKQQKQESKGKAPKGEMAQAAVFYRKAKRVAKSSGKLALEAYVNAHSALKVYFAKDIRRLVESTWTPKPKRTQEQVTA